MKRSFEKLEFIARCKLAQKLMTKNSLAAMLVCSEPEVRYYTGFHTPFWQSPTRPWFVAIPAHAKPIAIIPAIGETLMKQTWIDDIRTWDSPRPLDEGISLLADTLNEIAPHGKIGMPFGAETHLRIPHSDFKKLHRRVRAKFVDATNIVKQQRMIKSPAEIAKIKHICTIASNTFNDLPNFVRTGDSEIDIFKKMKINLLQNGADDVPYLVGGTGRGGVKDAISLPTTRRLKNGDMLMLDLGATFDGYHCDFDRNYACHKPTSQMQRAYEITFAATQAGIDSAKIGNTTSDLFFAIKNVFEKNDVPVGNVGRFGHGLGMQLTEWPSITKLDNTILQENMVLTIEPAMTFGNNNIMLHEENIVVKKHKAQLLTKRAPCEIVTIK